MLDITGGSPTEHRHGGQMDSAWHGRPGATISVPWPLSVATAEPTEQSPSVAKGPRVAQQTKSEAPQLVSDQHGPLGCRNP